MTFSWPYILMTLGDTVKRNSMQVTLKDQRETDPYLLQIDTCGSQKDTQVCRDEEQPRFLCQLY